MKLYIVFIAKLRLLRNFILDSSQASTEGARFTWKEIKFKVRGLQRGIGAIQQLAKHGSGC